jgi:putative endonuclease
MERACAVYIMTNRTNTVLYTGVTNDLGRRLFEHRTQANPHSFTARYNVHKLVYFEAAGSMFEAIRREKQIKGWLRRKKVALIEAKNARWEDLSSIVIGG